MAGKRNDPADERETWPSSFERLFSGDTNLVSENRSNDAADVLRAAATTARDTARPSPTIGTPEADTGKWVGMPTYPNAYSIRCEEFILRQFTGQDLSEKALVQEAMDNGLYTPGEGTRMEELGTLLELHGIEVNRYVQANQWQLAKELAEGHKVMIGVDSGELWETDSIIEVLLEKLGFQLSGADHAVIVSGIDTSDPDNIKVLVSDPGTGEPLASYPMVEFLDAWKDSDFYMVATEEPVPSRLPEMANFPYDQGHLNVILNVPYEHFLDLQFTPELWDDLFALRSESPWLMPGGSKSNDEPIQLDQVYERDYSSEVEPPQWNSLQSILGVGSLEDQKYDPVHNDDTSEG